MSITLVGEKWDSRNASIAWESKKADLKVLLSCTPTDTDDDTEVSAYGDTYAGSVATEYNLICQGYDSEPLGNGFWLLTVHYSNRVPKNPNDTTYNFDTGGGTQKITHSYATLGAYYNPDDSDKIDGDPVPANHHGAIGVTSDGNVEGCDIVVPQFNFSETHYIPVASVTSGFQGALYAATGMVNNAPWRTYDTGEVLFLGASGTQRGIDDWEITYKFQASPNASSLTVAPFTGINKPGWAYLWISYCDIQDPDSNPPAMAKHPVSAYVEQVYQSADFTTLGIGS
jgi:hypothetical protein